MAVESEYRKNQLNVMIVLSRCPRYQLSVDKDKNKHYPHQKVLLKEIIQHFHMPLLLYRDTTEEINPASEGVC